MNNLSTNDLLRAMTRAVLEQAERLHAERMERLKAYLEGGGEGKTEGAYRRQIWNAIRNLFNGEIDEYAFVDDVASYIDNQFTRAWNQGARDMGVNPRQFEDADIEALSSRIDKERNFMLQLADDILKARSNGGSIEPFRARSDMYANRYNDIVNEAHIHFGGKTPLRWAVGPTEHCSTCLALNGIVAQADDWAASGYRPQGNMLECGGYNCQCSLVPTDEPLTPSGIPQGL